MILNDKFIFIVESRPQFRIVFQIVLSRYGAWVEFESRAEHALTHLNRLQSVDLILLDLAFPGPLNGYGLFDQIRAQQKYAHVPIVGMTTFDSSTALPLARERGFNGLIIRPIDLNEFPAQVARIIEGEDTWPVASAAASRRRFNT
jgi:CheY-like chemotaxis protein